MNKNNNHINTLIYDFIAGVRIMLSSQKRKCNCKKVTLLRNKEFKRLIFDEFI